MAKRRKLLDRLIGGSKDIRFDDFLALLQDYGFSLDRVRGSHHVLSHPAVRHLLSVQPRHDGKAKPYQIRQFQKMVEEYNLEWEEE
jgi:predicted RNA binding protein YcfA (HicA-like mRNA interferase family)